MSKECPEYKYTVIKAIIPKNSKYIKGTFEYCYTDDKYNLMIVKVPSFGSEKIIYKTLD